MTESLDTIFPLTSFFILLFLILTVWKHLIRVRIVVAPEDLQLIAVVNMSSRRTRPSDLMNRGHL